MHSKQELQMVMSNLLDSVATDRPFMKIFINHLSTFYRLMYIQYKLSSISIFYRVSKKVKITAQMKMLS